MHTTITLNQTIGNVGNNIPHVPHKKRCTYYCVHLKNISFEHSNNIFS